MQSSSILDDLKSLVRSGDALTRLMVVNIGVWVSVNLIYVLLFLFYGGKQQHDPLFNSLLSVLEIKSAPKYLLYHIWTPFTYQFLHIGFWHLLFNMISLYWFGSILKDLVNAKRLLAVYFIGGLFGALFYVTAANLFPAHISTTIGSTMLGASASVLGVLLAAATVAPDYQIRIILIGDVALKYVALVFIFIDFISIPAGNNTGGHLAHIGGALGGWIFIKQLQRGNDWSLPFTKIFDWVGNIWYKIKQPTAKTSFKKPTAKKPPKPAAAEAPHAAPSESVARNEQAMIDAILDKIKRSGYDSLSAEERDRLFKFSKKS